MQQLQILDFNGQQIHTLNHNGQTVYLADDVLTKCAGYRNPSKSTFYTNNKNNKKYVVEIRQSNDLSKPRMYLTYEGVQQCLKTAKRRQQASDILIFLKKYHNDEMKLLKMLEYEGKKIPIYGTLEQPLFNTQDIMISLLKYKQCSDAGFFVEMRANKHYIVDDPDQNTKLQFFTEFGLYRCLTLSKKPMAEQFSMQVVMMLRDLRLGHIKIQVSEECDFVSKIISSEANNILANIAGSDDLKKQLEMVTMDRDNKHRKCILALDRDISSSKKYEQLVALLKYGIHPCTETRIVDIQKTKSVYEYLQVAKRGFAEGAVPREMYLDVKKRMKKMTQEAFDAYMKPIREEQFNQFDLEYENGKCWIDYEFTPKQLQRIIPTPQQVEDEHESDSSDDSDESVILSDSDQSSNEDALDPPKTEIIAQETEQICTMKPSERSEAISSQYVVNKLENRHRKYQMNSDDEFMMEQEELNEEIRKSGRKRTASEILKRRKYLEMRAKRQEEEDERLFEQEYAGKTITFSPNISRIIDEEARKAKQQFTDAEFEEQVRTGQFKFSFSNQQ